MKKLKQLIHIRNLLGSTSIKYPVELSEKLDSKIIETISQLLERS